MSFEPFNLDPALFEALEQANFTRASKVQQLVIPEVLQGKDILASAHSGSGKSASFVLPLIQRLLNDPMEKQEANDNDNDDDKDNLDESRQGPRVLILTPTRELANQVSACIRRFTKALDLRYGILVGGAPYPPQVRMLKRPVDFLVATPGRLLDHIHNDRVNFKDVEYLVIDEINRMVDMNIEKDLNEIVAHLPQAELGRQRQTLIFSGSLDSPEIEQLSQNLQHNVVRFELARSKQSYRGLQQSMYIADEGEHKFKLVQALIESAQSQHILVYSYENENLNKLKSFLESHMDTLHTDASMKLLSANQQSIYLLRDEQNPDDELSGLSDIKIIHLDLPDDILVFLKRLELAIDLKSQEEHAILVGKDDWPILHQVERYIGKTLSRKKIEGLEPESGEPSVSSKLSSGRTSNQTKNRNPYSGRRQNNTNQNNKARNKQARQNKDNTPSNKAKKPKNAGPNKNKRKNPNQQPLDNTGNTFVSDSYMDDRDLSWKQYISNISNGNDNKSANRKYRKNQGGRGQGGRAQAGGFDLNNSPMAISAKKVRDMNKGDDWANHEQAPKKPQVQIKVKGPVKGQVKKSDALSQIKENHDSERPEHDDNDRIDGKLGINK